ncbi:MAG TPA: hypothetical protein VKA27_09600, partial [Sunxiuqinia sp.]|nr:hypothetical protein [Sunxiuqinia sp.]
QFKMIKLRIVVGLPTFDMILDRSIYRDLRGGLLEAIGAIFQENVKVYLYPYIDTNTGEVEYPDDSHFSESNKLLWQYLNATKKIIVLKSIPSKNLEVSPQNITELIKNGDDKLKNYLPEKVFNHIKENKLFGYSSESRQTGDSVL